MIDDTLKCYRCGGIMVYEKFYGNCEWFWGWRCVICGEIVDQVILENRLDISERIKKLSHPIHRR